MSQFKSNIREHVDSRLVHAILVPLTTRMEFDSESVEIKRMFILFSHLSAFVLCPLT